MLVDATHSAGVLDVDVGAFPVDYELDARSRAANVKRVLRPPPRAIQPAGEAVCPGMNTIKTYLALLALAAATVLFLTACGGSNDSGVSPPGNVGAAGTVSVSSVDGVGDVLVDAQGAALYATDQEADGMVVCTDSCTAIWDPLTIGAGKPTLSGGVDGQLAVVKRPDGRRQVTLDGRLLYRFAEDPGAGVVTGNGVADSFAGQAFTWHVATATGISTTDANSNTSGGSSGYGYG